MVTPTLPPPTLLSLTRPLQLEGPARSPRTRRPETPGAPGAPSVLACELTLDAQAPEVEKPPGLRQGGVSCAHGSAFSPQALGAPLPGLGREPQQKIDPPTPRVSQQPEQDGSEAVEPASRGTELLRYGHNLDLNENNSFQSTQGGETVLLSLKNVTPR